MKICVNIKSIKTVALAAVFVCLVVIGCKKDEEEPPNTPTNPVANWTCNEVSKRDGTAQPFTVHIVKAPATGDTLLMENFYALGFDKKAKMIQLSNDSVYIKPLPQAVTPGVSVIKGYGKFNNSSSLTLFYIVDDGNAAGVDTVNATFTK